MPNDALSGPNGILMRLPGIWEPMYRFPSIRSCTWVGASPAIGTEWGITEELGVADG